MELYSRKVQFENIPNDLRELDQWVHWKTVNRDGKETKIPVSVLKKAASTTDPATWSSFDNVISKFDETHHSGIGFVFAANDPYVGIDLDGCRDPVTGIVADWAVNEVLRFSSYTEISPSQTGLKIWITADSQLAKGRNKKLRVPAIVPNKAPGIEVYSHGRFFAVTGKVYEGYSQVQQRSAELQSFLATYWPEASVKSGPRRDHKSDKSVVERARNYLAQMPGAISGSGGHNATFNVACVLVKGFDLPSNQAMTLISEWNAKCEPPWTKAELQHKISDAAKASGESGYLRNANPQQSDLICIPGHYQRQAIDTSVGDLITDAATFQRTYDETDRNDIGNAAHLSHVYRDELRFCAEWDKWLFWDGARWKLDDERRVLKFAKQLTTSMFSDAMEIYSSEIMSHSCRTASAPRLKAMIELAAPDLPIRVSEMDQHPWIFNCPNGALDLRTGQLFPNDRSMNITALSPTEYYPDAESPVWSKFLSDVFVEPEHIQFMQRLFGYFLTGVVSEQILPIFYGSGANGKSTLLNAFMDTIGPDYGMQCQPDFLMEKRGERHPTEMASLFGKRFVSCVETDDSRKLAESTVKMLTGGERIMARRMREDFWEFPPTHKIALCTNHRPVIRGTDEAIWRRLWEIPFQQRFEEARQDKRLAEKLRTERMGILAWAVRGCLEWRTIGLNPPKSVRDATAKYRSAEDVIGQFLSDCCVDAADDRVRFSDLYSRLRRWAEETGESLPKSRTFAGRLQERGYQKERSDGIWYRGLLIRGSESTAAEETERPE